MKEGRKERIKGDRLPYSSTNGIQRKFQQAQYELLIWQFLVWHIFLSFILIYSMNSDSIFFLFFSKNTQWNFLEFNYIYLDYGLPWWLSHKESVCNTGTTGDRGSGRSPGRGHGNPLQYSCLENSMDSEQSLAGYGPQGHRELDMTEAT